MINPVDDQTIRHFIKIIFEKFPSTKDSYFHLEVYARWIQKNEFKKSGRQIIVKGLILDLDKTDDWYKAVKEEYVYSIESINRERRLQMKLFPHLWTENYIKRKKYSKQIAVEMKIKSEFWYEKYLDGIQLKELPELYNYSEKLKEVA